MVCAPVRSIIPSLKLGDYLSVQAHNPCSISHKATDIFLAAQQLQNIDVDSFAIGLWSRVFSERVGKKSLRN